MRNIIFLIIHSAGDLQRLIERFSKVCRDFGQTMSQKKIQIMGQGVDAPYSIKIAECELEAVHNIVYLGLTLADSLCLNMRLSKAATIMLQLNKHIWTNNQLTEHTKFQIYKACVLSTTPGTSCMEARHEWT